MMEEESVLPILSITESTSQAEEIPGAQGSGLGVKTVQESSR